MQVNIPMLVQDPLTSVYKGMAAVDTVEIAYEDFFLDGPVTRRVAVLDLDPDTNQLRPGVRYVAPARGRKIGTYAIANANDLYAPDFNQVSVFATIFKTMYMFERDDTLGRPVQWGFGAPQLLVIPRAGQWANAFYERESHSLQFFYFPDPHDDAQTIYTSLSRDVVAHETGHAILDGIAPQLYNAVTPQSLAMHEAIADLVAALIAFSSGTLLPTVMTETQGSIEKSNAFSSVAEEFGHALDASGQAGYLRSLLNAKTLCPNDTTMDELRKPNRVSSPEPHDLSEVLSGALYAVLVKMHNALKQEALAAGRQDGPAMWISTLATAVARFKRIILRGLDYMAPGDSVFADYARAMIAADQAAHPDDTQERGWLREEFLRRCIVPNEDALTMQTNFDDDRVRKLDLEMLVESDSAAYEFANRARDLLHIPDEVTFHVEPRLVVTKRYRHRDGDQMTTECLFKVWWREMEPDRVGNRWPGQRRITVGTTLAIDSATRQVRALLTSDRREHRVEGEQQRDDRDRFLQQLVSDGTLNLGPPALAPGGRGWRAYIQADDISGILRVRGMARMLHITGGRHDG